MTKTMRKYRRTPDYAIADDNQPTRYHGPYGFQWLIKGILGGAPRPGIIRDAEQDIYDLERVGTKLLITLNESWAPPIKTLQAHGMESFQMKFSDIHVPSFEQAAELCALVDDSLSDHRPCVYHCRAGHGRTGTMLAAQLVYYGTSADSAVAQTRARHASWIDNPTQLDFLAQFERYLGQ